MENQPHDRKTIKKIKVEQVGELLQAIYDCEAHLKIEWLWDGGFEFAFGFWDDFDDHPKQVKEAYKTIDATRIEEVASLILLEFELNYSIINTEKELNPIGQFIERLNLNSESD